MDCAARRRLTAAFTGRSSPGRGTRRARASGCSLLTTMMRAPDLRMSGVSGACIRPSSVRSSTRLEALSAAIAAGWPCRARDAPVERKGTGVVTAGLGRTQRKGRKPACSAASSARSTFIARDCVSISKHTTSPGVGLHCCKTVANAASQSGSIRSTSMLSCLSMSIQKLSALVSALPRRGSGRAIMAWRSRLCAAQSAWSERRTVYSFLRICPPRSNIIITYHHLRRGLPQAPNCSTRLRLNLQNTRQKHAIGRHLSSETHQYRPWNEALFWVSLVSLTHSF